MLLADAYEHLASLTGARPMVCLAVLNRVYWNQVASPLPYPAPGAHWDDQVGSVFVPEAYTGQFLRGLYLPETMAAWTSWPPVLSDVGEPARATALADLLAVRELAFLFLRELKVAPADPALNRLLVAYLTHIVIHARRGRGTGEMGALWDFWGEVLAGAGHDEGRIRLQAKALFESHGDNLVASLSTSRTPV